MPSIELPKTLRMKGVFWIGREELIALDKLVKSAKGEMEKHRTNKVREKVETEFEHELKLASIRGKPIENEESKRRELREAVKNRYPYDQSECKVSLKCRSQKQITGTSFAQLLEMPELKSEWPTEADVKLRVLDRTIHVEIETGEFSSIRISAQPSDNAMMGRLSSQLAEWGAEQLRFPTWHRYKYALAAVGWMLFPISLILLPLALLSTNSEENELAHRAAELSENGLSDSEQAEAIDILLKLSTGNYDPGTVVAVREWWLLFPFMAALSLALFYMAPTSVIGIGAAAARLRRFRKTEWLASNAITVWGVGIMTSIIATILYELFR